jgi:hypothetical protein
MIASGAFLLRLINYYRWRWKFRIIETVPERDANKEALDHVEKATDSERIKGEELVESEERKRQFREAKKRIESETEESEESA